MVGTQETSTKKQRRTPESLTSGAGVKATHGASPVALGLHQRSMAVVPGLRQGRFLAKQTNVPRPGELPL